MNGLSLPQSHCRSVDRSLHTPFNQALPDVRPFIGKKISGRDAARLNLAAVCVRIFDRYRSRGRRFSILETAVLMPVAFLSAPENDGHLKIGESNAQRPHRIRTGLAA